MPSGKIKKNATSFVPAAEWTFLTNHAHVLICVQRDSLVLVKEIAVQVGITERAVLGILADLERAGIVKRHRRGRSNVYEVNPNHPLRHPLERHRQVRDLLHLVLRAPPQTAPRPSPVKPAHKRPQES